MAKSLRAIIYARFSPRRNAEECESIPFQFEKCRELCASKGWIVEAERSDERMSGDVEDRPGLWEAIELTRAGRVLVVWRGDRLARDVYFDEAIRRTVARQGGIVHVVEGSPNGEDPTATLIRQILSAFAEYERKLIAARTKAAMLRHQSAGRVMSKVIPYGWKEIDPIVIRSGGRDKLQRRIAPCEHELAMIEVVKAHATAGKNHNQIARAMNSAGYRVRGRVWRPKLVRSILVRSGHQPLQHAEAQPSPR